MATGAGGAGGRAAGGGGSEQGGGALGGGGGTSDGAGGTGGGGASSLGELGDPCDFGGACASGFCADGVCCDGACDSACDACSEALTGLADGSCAPASSGTICRAAAGGCDLVEACDGRAVECPADAVEDLGVTCRASGGDCDPAELCDGASPACPSDVLSDQGTVCRPSAGGCDVEEQCDGAATSCPPDQVAAGGTTCRPAAGPCDVPDVCNGVDTDCGVDDLLPAGSVCRTAAGPCDIDDLCSGVSAECGPDVFEPQGVEEPLCDPFVCSGGPLCLVSCTTDADCADTNRCVEGQCQQARRVFVTSTTYTGNLGGLAGADGLCAARAQAAGLPGTFKAWLSAGTTTPLTTFVNSNIPWVRLDGVKIADNFADLTDTAIDAPIMVTELGVNLGAAYHPVWTGTNSLGNQQGVNCNGWTTFNGVVGGWHGNASLQSFEWTSYTALVCNTPARLYCFEQ